MLISSVAALTSSAAALFSSPPPAAADVAVVAEKAYEDTSVGYSILPIRGWEPKPRKNPDDPLARTVNSPNDAIATAGAGPSRMRGVCGVIATARNGEGDVAHASQVPDTAR